MSVNLKKMVLDHLKDFFKNREVAGDPMVKRVIAAYPNTPKAIPCIAVTVSSTTLEGGALGLDFGYWEDPDTGIGYELDGAYFRKTLEVRYFSDSHELREVVRPLLEMAIFSMFTPFDEAGAQLPQISGGADEQDFSEEAPHELYMIPFTVSFRVPMVTTREFVEKAEGVDVAIGYLNAGEDPDEAFIERVKRLMGAQ